MHMHTFNTKLDTQQGPLQHSIDFHGNKALTPCMSRTYLAHHELESDGIIITPSKSPE